MRYFERLRLSLRLCGQQATYHTHLKGVHRFLCDDHYTEPQRRVMDDEFTTVMTANESLGKGCDYETTV